jgi:WD40 repeat protein
LLTLAVSRFAKIPISRSGALLALCTRGTERPHILRLYDIRNRNAKAIGTINLESFPSDIEGEVNSAAFSPDGIHLALARNDNHTHIYDSRKLDKLLFDFEHNGACRKSPGSDSYGVVHAEWVERDSRRLPVGLVTGGHDGRLPLLLSLSITFHLTDRFTPGCVRFWDPLRSAEDPVNGMILAETNSDVGFFSIGDHFAGERDLVV